MLVLNAMSHSIMARDIEDKPKQGLFSQENLIWGGTFLTVFAAAYGLGWYAHCDSSKIQAGRDLMVKIPASLSDNIPQGFRPEVYDGQTFLGNARWVVYQDQE